jgi:hypothetical protein
MTKIMLKNGLKVNDACELSILYRTTDTVNAAGKQKEEEECEKDESEEDKKAESVSSDSTVIHLVDNWVSQV